MKKGISPVFVIIAIIVGVALYKQFNFQHNRFEKPALSIVYFICLVFSIVVIVRGAKKDKNSQ